MELLPNIDGLTSWLIEYGSIALFILLCLGIVALPVPEETLMVVAGILMANNILTIPATVTAAFLGSVCGITFSYLLGKTAGSYFFHKWGSWFGITEARLQKVHNWFERFGKWTLVIGYFIPGVRHLTGFCAGTTELDYRSFALYAYLGALFWVSTFLSIGYFFCDHCLSFFSEIEIKLGDITFVGSIVVICVAIFYLRHRSGAHREV